MKILVVSDNHREEKILTEIVQKMGDQVDLMIHCGDSELAPDQDPMSNFKAVKGNNDYGLSYPNELVINAGQEQLYLTHGHLQQVNFSLTPLMLTGQEKNASIVCYGHTHQLGAAYDHQMLIINPGSISFPRGEYAKLGGTFAIIDAQPERFIVDYYNRQMEAVPELHCEFSRQK
ncbi:phosphodiesterase [Limosilactobacillus reuteri]|uniref:Phosphoesterase n=1 Tax=Limosilactobacillus reuteri TaxID=1598 RepID=A0A073JRR7_LIMRT|nr:metallophosphoesterase [Limosilactobacillus reuteri]KEK13689.1 phosphodiesterase [Limosilactobacillus reuteri]KEK16798.1 phosphodiesterase [Limosilactobacillus reuteri]KEQ19867.1 phosphodiesterase [Limosilactobacillus reuteri]MCT3199608.1 metallophosphoesterase [Limosilactobacillus reuteri]MRI07958.1 YfcE family phosphodiesterase [Limosilactobacillus reuteri]